MLISHLIFMRRLRNGETVDLDGLRLRGLPAEEIKPGDLYIGCRNQGPLLGIARKIDRDLGCIFAEDNFMYSYNIGECVKVEEA